MLEIMLPKEVQFAMGRLEKHGHRAYVVGGCVRDALLGKTPQDWDLCTDALPDRIKQCFADQRVLSFGEKHGTITLVLEQCSLEITTFRAEDGYRDHRRPDSVRFHTDLAEDLKRRDFTVNAMAYHPKEGLQDHHGGREDLLKGIIRCVGDAEERFAEDALRILRALRFASTLDFTIDPITKEALLRQSRGLRWIAVERIQKECFGLLCGKGCGRILGEYGDVLLSLTDFFPSLPPHVFAENRSIWQTAMDKTPADPILRLSILPALLGRYNRGTREAFQKELFRFLQWLRLPKGTHKKLQNILLCSVTPETDRLSLKRQMAEHGAETVWYILQRELALSEASARPHWKRLLSLREEILQRNACLRRSDLALQGRDLLALGIPSGPMVGKMIDRLFELVLNETLPNTKTALIAYVRQNFLSGEDMVIPK